MKKNIQSEFCSVYDRNWGRQINNLQRGSLTDALRPWFKEVWDKRVEKALLDLGTTGAKQRRAQEYLGLEIVPA